MAARDASLPVAEHLAHLRSPLLHGWQPPGGGAAGALSHAVIHSLDVTIVLDRPAVAPVEAVVAVLDRGDQPAQGLADAAVGHLVLDQFDRSHSCAQYRRTLLRRTMRLRRTPAGGPGR